MRQDLKGFWSRLQTGVEVAVADTASDKLLGVRDGFLRYFHDGLDRPVPVVVIQQPEAGERSGLADSDEATVRLAREKARALAARLGDAYHFYVASEGGLHTLEIDGALRYFVRNWTVIAGSAGEACGSSGSVQIPDRLIAGLDGEQIPFSVPGTRRSGGMISSLTGKLETRRTATASATFHALSTLFYGILESRPVRRR